MQPTEIRSTFEEAYGIAIANVQPVAEGHTTEKHRLSTDRGEFVLRVRSGGIDVTAVTRDHAFMRHLRDRGVPVPEPLETLEGTTAVVRNGKLFEVHSWIEHDADLASFVFPAVSTKLCTALGEFHRAAASFPLSIEKPNYLTGTLLPTEPRTKYIDGPLEYGVQRYQEAASELSRTAQAEFRQTVETLAARLSGFAERYDVAYDAGPTFVNHNDFYENNILFLSGEVAGIVDFDFCQTALYAVDLVEALHGAMIWHTSEETFLGLSETGEVRLDEGEAALSHYLSGMSGLRPDGRFLIDFLIAKVISLAFFPAFDFWPSASEKREGLARVAKTVAALGEIGELRA